MCGYGKVCAYVFSGSGACILRDLYCAGTAMVALPPLLFLLLVCSSPNVTLVMVVFGRGATMALNADFVYSIGRMLYNLFGTFNTSMWTRLALSLSVVFPFFMSCPFTKQVLAQVDLC